MNNLGSNNLVPHVHVLYLNVRTKWKKNQVQGPNMGGCPITQVWPIDHQKHHYDGQCFYKLCANDEPDWPKLVGRPTIQF